MIPIHTSPCHFTKNYKRALFYQYVFSRVPFYPISHSFSIFKTTLNMTKALHLISILNTRSLSLKDCIFTMSSLKCLSHLCYFVSSSVIGTWVVSEKLKFISNVYMQNSLVMFIVKCTR